jgi:hypothetical protein
MPEFLKRAWERWKAIAHVIGNFQARLLLSVFYIILTPMFALIVKAKDPLDLRSGNRESYWRQRPTTEEPDALARRQF